MNYEKDTPCRGCDARNSMCHSNCKRYSDWTDRRREKFKTFVRPELLYRKNWEVNGKG